MNASFKPILKEVRFLVSSVDLESAGLKKFLNNNISKLYSKDYKFLIRECNQIEPTIIARYSKYKNNII